MKVEEEYQLSQYQDLGLLDERKNIHIKRHKIYGYICIEKIVPGYLEEIYRFLKETAHSCVPYIYECIREEDKLIVMEEYITGRNLEDILRENVFKEEDAIRVLLKICDGVKILHHADPPIVCRDLKPENIMIDSEGNVKIVDFNIARIVQKGSRRDTRLLGTVEYAAPEQYGFFQTDNRTDIYALGVLLNYMIVKKYPVELLVSGPLEMVIKKCTSMDPKDRYQTVEELERQLLQYCPEYEKVDKSKKEKKENSWIPPGFRTKTPWKMLIAILGYITIFYMCFSLELTKEDVQLEGISLVLEQFIICISQLMFVGIVCDYRGCREYFSIVNQKNKVLKVGAYVLVYVGLFIAAAFIAACKDMIIM